jgi:fumarate reductase flavoprotein subunit
MVTKGLNAKSSADKTAITWDLVVVGGGTAGIPAAIFAARRGARVLIVEAADQLGGTLFLSAGQMSAAGTKVQRMKGVEDTPQEHFDDIIRISHDTVDRDLVRLAVFNAADTFDWLMDRGLDMLPEHPIKGLAHEPYSKPRYYWGEKMGLSILEVLLRELQPELQRGAVAVHTSTRVTELIQDADGAVTGVVATDDLGKTSRHSARHVLLACGGYGSNPDLFEELSGYQHYFAGTYPKSVGAGIQLGVAAGGYVRGRQNFVPNFGVILADDNFPSVIEARADTYPESRQPWEIYVNSKGERFVAEDHPSVDVREHALLEQPDMRFWIVFDDEIFNAATPIIGETDSWTRQEMVEAFDSHPMFYRAETMAALADATGINEAGLTATLGQYNQAQADGSDAFSRRHMPRSIGKPPFYAIRLQGGSLMSIAGLAVSAELRVIRENGTPIANLYAAGELLGSGQTMGNATCGGMMVTPALTFGRLLGDRILEL